MIDEKSPVTDIDYNKIADEYNKYGSDAITDDEMGYRNVLGLLGDIKGKKILDYGCGPGKFSFVLKQGGAEVIGVDIAESELEIARNKNPNIDFFLVNEIEAKLTSDFDAVVLNFVTTAISSEEVISKIFTRAYTVLKSGGMLVLLNPNLEKSAGREFLTSAFGQTQQKIGEPVKIFLGTDRSLEIEDYFYSQDFYIQKLNDAGFEIEQILEPLAEDSSFPWKDETQYPPFLLISAIAKKEKRR